MGRLFYVPLESYAERYTLQWSAPKTGWIERNLIKAGIDYVRIDGEKSNATRTIKTGCVLDAVGRSIHCFSQIKELLLMAESGAITDKDTIYFDDFWHAGIEALPYAFDLFNVHPEMYAFLHAQSVDEFDFTAAMKWIRPFETGIGNVLDGIFVCCPMLEELCIQGGIAPRGRFYVTGHPFSSEEVMERMPNWYQNAIARPKTCSTLHRLNQVVYSSRWDNEKNPGFFLDVAKEVIRRRQDVRFVICTGATKIRSNRQELLDRLYYECQHSDGLIVLKEGLTKEEYYSELCKSKVQFNCANQDWIAITLLEASVAGCYPVYPYFRSFPEAFLHNYEYMYEHLDKKHAADKICEVMNHDDLWSYEAIKSREWLHSRFDTSWVRMLEAMGIEHGQETTEDPYKE